LIKKVLKQVGVVHNIKPQQNTQDDIGESTHTETVVAAVIDETIMTL